MMIRGCQLSVAFAGHLSLALPSASPFLVGKEGFSLPAATPPPMPLSAVVGAVPGAD